MTTLAQVVLLTCAWAVLITLGVCIWYTFKNVGEVSTLLEGYRNGKEGKETATEDETEEA